MRRFDDFDPFAANYADLHNRNLAWTGARSDALSAERVQHVADDERGMAVAGAILDLGCGDGSTEVHLGRAFPAAEIVGIDPSEASIAIARQRGLERCRFLAYDGERIPFPDASFDLVMICGVLHHVARERHGALLSECRRVLKEGGRLYVFEHNPVNPLTRLIVATCPFDRDAVMIGAAPLTESAEQAGFKNRRLRYFIFFPRFSAFRGLIRLEKSMAALPLGGKYYLRATR